MKNMKTLVALALSAAVAIPTVALATKVRIFTQKVDSGKICGTEYGKYECATTRKHMRLSEADIELQMDGDAPRHLQVLGKVYTDLAATGLSLRPCGAVDENVFDANDLAPLTSPTTFTYKKRSDTKVDAGLQADVKNALVAAGVPAGPALENLQADFKASYSQAAGRENNMTGSYYRVALKENVINSLQNPATGSAKALSCSQFIRAHPGAALIYSISVIKLDSATYASSIATDAAANFAAKVRAKAPNADIAGVQAGVSSAVRTSLNTAMGRSYRIISWDYLTAEDMHES